MSFFTAVSNTFKNVEHSIESGIHNVENQVASTVHNVEQAVAAPIHNFTSQRSSGMPARMGEFNIGASMMKAQLQSAAAAMPARAQIANGETTTVYPANGNSSGSHTIYINGIGTSSDSALGQAQTLANASGAPIDAIYQQDSIGNVALHEAVNLAIRMALLGPFGGLGSGLATAKADLKKQLDNPEAANAAASEMISQLGSPNSSGEVRIIGYSQGAHITAEALKIAKDRLTSQYGADGANQMLSRVHVLTLGGAASRSDFPPQVDLTQVFHKHDPVAQFFGDDHTSLFTDLKNGTHIFDPHTTYMSDQNTLNVINSWQNGNVANRDIQLND